MQNKYFICIGMLLSLVLLLGGCSEIVEGDPPDVTLPLAPILGEHFSVDLAYKEWPKEIPSFLVDNPSTSSAEELPWEARKEFAFVSWKAPNESQEALYILGGKGDSDEVFQDVWKSTNGGKTWVQSPDLPGPRYGLAAAVGEDNKLYVSGGKDENGKIQRDLWSWDGGSAKFESLGGFVGIEGLSLGEQEINKFLGGRYGHQMRLAEAGFSEGTLVYHLVIIGGSGHDTGDGYGVVAYQKNQNRLVPLSGSHAISNNGTYSHFGAGAIPSELNSRFENILTLGGIHTPTNNVPARPLAFRSGVTGVTWSPIQDPPSWMRRVGMQLLVSESKIYAIGGYGAGVQNADSDAYQRDVQVLPFSPVEWADNAVDCPANWGARSHFGATMHRTNHGDGEKNYFYVAGGRGADGLLYQDVWYTSDVKEAWKSVVEDEPSPTQPDPPVHYPLDRIRAISGEKDEVYLLANYRDGYIALYQWAPQNGQALQSMLADGQQKLLQGGSRLFFRVGSSLYIAASLKENSSSAESTHTLYRLLLNTNKESVFVVQATDIPLLNGQVLVNEAEEKVYFFNNQDQGQTKHYFISTNALTNDNVPINENSFHLLAAPKAGELEELSHFSPLLDEENRLYLLGGEIGGKATSTVYQVEQWAEQTFNVENIAEAGATFSPRSHGTAVLVQDKWWIFTGGKNGQNKVEDFYYSSDGARWELFEDLSTSGRIPAYLADAVTVSSTGKRETYFVGGYSKGTSQEANAVSKKYQVLDLKETN